MTADFGTAGMRRAAAAIRSRLSECQVRWVAAMFSLLVGHGGDKQAAQLFRLCARTVSQGRCELRANLGPVPKGRVRRKGAGRKPLAEKRPELGTLLDELLDDSTGGSPEGGARFTRRSTRALARELTERLGEPIGKDLIASELKKGSTR